jgi:hypothetical protein
MRQTRTRRTLVAAAALSMLAVIPQAAIAQEAERDPGITASVEERQHPKTIEEIKALAMAAIEKRLTALDRIGTKVAADEHVTDDHASQLTTHYARAKEGLETLGREIQAAETREELKELVPLIATDYRVFLVIIPKSHEVLVSDRFADAVTRLTGVADSVLNAIERAEDAGFDMTEARRWLTEARDEIGAVERGAVPVAGEVIGLTAADWEEPAKSLLSAGKEKLRTARGDVEDAVDVLKKARLAIEDAIG